MSRQRKNFIFDRNSLPVDISYIVNRNYTNAKYNENKAENISSNKISNEDVIFFKKPKFRGSTKEYTTQNTQQLYFHEKSTLMTKIEKKNIGWYEETEEIIDFEKFLSLFQNENEINNLELQDLLDTDFEKLSELKSKAEEFTDATSTLLEEKMRQDNNTNFSESFAPIEELMNFFMEKLNEMKQNELNLKIFIDNLERVKGISYSQNGVKIYYKKN